MATPSSSSSTATTTTTYKGKTTSRSWNTLPSEILKLIVTHFLLDVSESSYIPQTWEHREQWLPRMSFTVVRDADALETIMLVSPAWRTSLEHHLFWQQASVVLDPQDTLFCFQNAPYRMSPYRHFRFNILERCCVPCRINQPTTSTGLGTAKRRVLTFTLGAVPCCKEHRKERFCGICLRDMNSDESIAENEDTETWQGIEATCRMCRGEWLWKACAAGSREKEAIGGRNFAAVDWETRQAVDAFVEVGEGTIREVIALAVEKWWLRKNTKIAEMMNLAVATSKLQTRVAANADRFEESEEELSGAEVDDDDEDDDPELLSITEDVGGVRDLAINDWARHRILDGFWVSPADQWFSREQQRQLEPPSYTNSPQLQPAYPPGMEPTSPYIPAQHPCSWTLTEDELNRPHPSPAMMRSSPPPSFALCSAAFEAFKKQLHNLLRPAMNNIVRRIVIECTADGVDACVRVTRMSLDDVANALRDSRTWYNGMDWLHLRRSESHELDADSKAASHDQGKDDSDDSSSSSKSSSHTTSPVLSTSTLQTTPSPPPRSENSLKKSDEGHDGHVHPPSSPPPSTATTRSSLKPVSLNTSTVVLPIAISPVLESPTPIPSIPFIPESISDLPHFTVEAFKTIWRDACAPLFQCRCSVCERAVLKANIEAGNVVPSQDQDQYLYGRLSAQSDLDSVQLQQQLLYPVVQVQLVPASDDGDELEAVSPVVTVSDNENRREVEEEEEEEEEEAADGYGYLREASPEGEETPDGEETPEARLPTPRTAGKKRSCEAIEYVEDEHDEDETGSARDGERGGTPPKRARVGDAPHSLKTHPVTSRHVEKRRSEELDDAVASAQAHDVHGHVQHKRARTESGNGEPISLPVRSSNSPAPHTPPTSESPSEEGDYVLQYVTGSKGRTAEPRKHAAVKDVVNEEPVNLDGEQLYTLEDSSDD